MSQSNLERLARDLKTDGALRAEMARAPDAKTRAEIAARRGYQITADELSASAKILSDDALGGVSGGTTNDPRRGIPGEIFGPPKK